MSEKNSRTTIKFSDFITLQRGFDLPEHSRSNGMFPVIASTAVAGYHNEYKVKSPIVATWRSWTLWEVQYIESDGWPLNTTLWVKDFKWNYPKFVYFFLKTLNLKQFNSGAGVPTLNRNHLDQIEITIPISYEIQEKIASFLSNYDNLIENNSKRIKILEQTAQEVYKEWFVKFKFPGHESATMVDSGTDFWMIPDGWEIKGILETGYFRFINENIKPFAWSKTYLATADIDWTNIISSGEIIEFISKPSRAQKQPVLNSVWFARMQDTFKVLGFSDANSDLIEKVCLSSGMAGFQSSPEFFPFLYFTINSEDFHKKKDLYCTGATQRSLTNEGLSQIKIITPPMNVLVHYGQSLCHMLNQIFILQQQNTLLKKSRDLLIPKLIKWEIDVEKIKI